MSISFTLPPAIEEGLRAQFGDVDAAAKEAALVELYRQGKLSHGQFAEALEISRDETNGVLHRHQVTEDLQSIEEFDEQMAQLRNLLGP
jgi:predicted HTH domain antitoxin